MANPVFPTWPGGTFRDFEYGPAFFRSAAYTGADRTTNGTEGRWVTFMVKLDGFTAQRLKFNRAFVYPNNIYLAAGPERIIDNFAVALYTSDGKDLTLVDGTMREQPARGGDAAIYDVAGATSVQFDFASDPIEYTHNGTADVWMALMLHKREGASTAQPFYRGTGTTDMPNGTDKCLLFNSASVTEILDATDYSTGTPTAAIPSTLAIADATDSQAIQFQIWFESDALMLQQVSPILFTGTKRYFIARTANSGETISVSVDMVDNVADTDTLTVDFRKMDDSATVGVVSESITPAILDNGATDRITFGGVNANLTAAELVNKPVDFLCQFTEGASASTANLWFINREQSYTGFSGYYPTRSHYGTVNGSQGEYSLTGHPQTPEWITVSRTGTTGSVNQIRVGSHVGVYFGDSQMSVYSFFLLSQRDLPIGINGALARPPIAWLGGVPGNRLTENASGAHEAGWRRFEHDSNEAINLSRIKNAIFFMMWGVNDISVGVTGTEDSDAAKYTELETVADILHRLSWIVQKIGAAGTSRGQRAILLDIPTWGPTALTAEPTNQKVSAAQRLRDGVRGLAAAFGCAYVSPWTLTNPTDHTDDDLHLNTSGGEVVGKSIRPVIENNVAAEVAGVERRQVTWSASGLPYVN